MICESTMWLNGELLRKDLEFLRWKSHVHFLTCLQLSIVGGCLATHFFTIGGQMINGDVAKEEPGNEPGRKLVGQTAGLL